MYTWHFEIITDNWEVFANGALMTAQLTLLAFVCAIILGLVLALCRLSHSWILRAPATLYIEVFRSTPALVQLVWIYYALPIITGIRLSGFISVALGLGLHTAAYFGE